MIEAGIFFSTYNFISRPGARISNGFATGGLCYFAFGFILVRFPLPRHQSVFRSASDSSPERMFGVMPSAIDSSSASTARSESWALPRKLGWLLLLFSCLRSQRPVARCLLGPIYLERGPLHTSACCSECV